MACGIIVTTVGKLEKPVKASYHNHEQSSNFEYNHLVASSSEVRLIIVTSYDMKFLSRNKLT